MKIVRVVIVTGPHQPDKVMLWADLPSAVPKVSKQPLMLSFDAEADTGADYVRKHFNLESEIIKG